MAGGSTTGFRQPRLAPRDRWNQMGNGTLDNRSGSNQAGCDRAGVKSQGETKQRLFNLYLSQQGPAFHRRAQQTAGRAAGTPRLAFLERGGTGSSRSLLLLRLPASLLTIAFTGQGLLDAELLAWLQIKGVPFDFRDDVLLHNLSLEAAERVLHRLAVL